MAIPSSNNQLLNKQYELINADKSIFSLLSSLLDQKNSISISTGNNTASLNSTLVKIDLHNKHLAIQKIQNDVTHKKLLKQKLFIIHSQFNGTELQFSCPLIGLTGINNSEYLLRLPKQIKFVQRRISHRVHVSLALDVTASLVNNEGAKYKGQIRDISTEGMRIQFVKTPIQELRNQLNFADCIINIPDDSDIHCVFNICHLQAHTTNKGCTIGGNFEKLENFEKKTIQSFIASLERKSLRNFRM